MKSAFSAFSYKKVNKNNAEKTNTSIKNLLLFLLQNRPSINYTPSLLSAKYQLINKTYYLFIDVKVNLIIIKDTFYRN